MLMKIAMCCQFVVIIIKIVYHVIFRIKVSSGLLAKNS